MRLPWNPVGHEPDTELECDAVVLLSLIMTDMHVESLYSLCTPSFLAYWNSQGTTVACLSCLNQLVVASSPIFAPIMILAWFDGNLTNILYFTWWWSFTVSVNDTLQYDSNSAKSICFTSLLHLTENNLLLFCRGNIGDFNTPYKSGISSECSGQHLDGKQCGEAFNPS